MRNARPAALAVALALAAPPAARAGEGEPVLEHSTRDLYVTGTAAAVWLALELARDELAPASCRVCGGNAFDDAARDLLVWGHVDRARTASDVLAAGVLPAAAAGYLVLAARGGPGVREGWWDFAYVAEAGALAGSLTSMVKLAVGRQRPYAVHGNWVEADRAPKADDNLSFWSGHTAFAFAIATSAGTIASMRGRDEAPWVWTTGLVLASAVGWLRVAGDAHHLTDVLAGAAVGTGLGIAVPRLFHGERGGGSASVALVPLPLGFAGTF